ncbi:hypothetical protein EDD22DRAFT_847394 [Suillus occidentalis]|nr:hypothetical protein EDD22DRAFT_847394 [Suillus occidentalis]
MALITYILVAALKTDLQELFHPQFLQHFSVATKRLPGSSWPSLDTPYLPYDSAGSSSNHGPASSSLWDKVHGVPAKYRASAPSIFDAVDSSILGPTIMPPARTMRGAQPTLESLLAQFQKVLWAYNGGEPDKDSTGVARWAWNLLDIICRILELAGLLGFTFAAANFSRDPASLRRASFFSQGDSHSPEDLTGWWNASTSPIPTTTKQHLTAFCYWVAMDFLIIDVTCAISNWSALVRNSDWHLHLYGDRQIDRCISMIPEYCDFEPPMEHAFYKASILLRIAPEQTSDTSLDSVTEQRWWDPCLYNTSKCLSTAMVYTSGIITDAIKDEVNGCTNTPRAKHV